ncbi:MAG TPA: TetR/AcrR family transcriptional regulator [Acidimicrobiales bacterium]|jgi:AcrR family transcriptional regulator|nr:TetR/AcrR family transcriptional regulator [Acidimicrobiales bacterium]
MAQAADRTVVGRPLERARDGELRRAALELVGEIGYDRLTIDAVAARVKAGKATVYRRWESKADLVVDAFLEEMFGSIATPDTGNLRDDLVGLSAQIWVDGDGLARAQILAGLISALLNNDDLQAAFNDTCKPPIEMFDQLVTRAVARGEIPEPANRLLIGWIMPGLCIFRITTSGIAPDLEFIESVIDHLVVPALLKGTP